MNRKAAKPANQGSIDMMFSKAASKKTETHEEKKLTKLMSEKPEVQNFYNSLQPAEIIAHTIAIEKLGTSYDVERTRGFVEWKNRSK